MAKTALPEGVKTETVTWHKADGTPTKDQKEAVTGEVVTMYDDGQVEHTILRRPNKPAGDV
jgi:hypothetical protein